MQIHNENMGIAATTNEPIEECNVHGKIEVLRDGKARKVHKTNMKKTIQKGEAENTIE